MPISRTAEIQEERREKYGEAVLHWHLVVAFEPDVRFDKEDIVRIQRSWKYGNVDVKPIRKLNLNYILKYIQKALDTPLIEYHGLRVRKISMSRIPVMYRYFREKVHRIIEWFDCHTERIGKFFKVDKKGIYYEYWDSAWSRWRKDYALVLNSWQIVDSYDYDGEPF